MNPRRVKFACAIAVLAVFVAIPQTSRAQAAASATLSGKITGPSGQVVPNAKISVKDVATGQAASAQSDAGGSYTVPNLAPGKYLVSITADGFSASTQTLTLAAGATHTLNVSLTSGLSLGSLGFPQSQIQGNAQEQERLDRRTRMLTGCDKPKRSMT